MSQPYCGQDYENPRPFRITARHRTGAARYFSEERGLRSIAVETAIDTFPEYAFTLSGTTTDYQDVGIEISETPYPSILENVVLDGKSRSVPISLYSAFPERQSAPANYKERVDPARVNRFETLPDGIY